MILSSALKKAAFLPHAQIKQVTLDTSTGILTLRHMYITQSMITLERLPSRR
jgi:hypothetical protein